MRILFVTPYYYPELKFGGPPQKIHSLGRELRRKGNAVRVITFDSEKRARQDQATHDNVPVQYLPWRGWGLRQWPVNRRLIRDAVAEADIIHCYGLYNALCPVAASTAQKLHRPVLVEPLGMYHPRGSSKLVKRLFHGLVTHRMFRQAACVVATSPAELDELKQAVSGTRLVLRRNGIDLGEYQTLPARAVFREKTKVSSGERIALYLGRISPVKNLEDLLRAFARAALKHCTLVLAGPELEPDYSAKLRGLVRQLNLEKTVLFPGALYAKDKLAALAAADLFILPSLSESFGNAAAEAAAAGVPVLLTDTCGIAPMIHRRAGLAVPLGVDSLADGLRTLLDDADQREALTNRRVEVVKELSWTQPVEQMEKLYKEIRAMLKFSNPEHSFHPC